MALHQYQQPQPFTHGDEPIDIDSLGIQEAVARRPNQFDESTFMPSTFENNRQLLAAIAAQQLDTGRMALDPSSLSVYTDGNTRDTGRTSSEKGETTTGRWHCVWRYITSRKAQAVFSMARE